MNKLQGKNLLELVPSRNQDFEIDGEKVIILLPKFRSGFGKRFIQPRIKKKHFRIQLDEIGAAFWQEMDGKRNVREIASVLQQMFGEKIEPVYDRLGVFIANMLDGDMIKLEDPNDP